MLREDEFYVWNIWIKKKNIPVLNLDKSSPSTNQGNISSLRVTKTVAPVSSWGRAERNAIAVQYACAFVQNVPQGNKYIENLKCPCNANTISIRMRICKACTTRIRKVPQGLTTLVSIKKIAFPGRGGGGMLHLLIHISCSKIFYYNYYH